MKKLRQVKGVKAMIDARVNYKRKVNLMLDIIASLKNMKVSLFKAKINFKRNKIKIHNTKEINQ